jgi:hypothetical protein
MEPSIGLVGEHCIELLRQGKDGVALKTLGSKGRENWE